MIKVTLGNIRDFDLPLDTNEKVMERGESKKILKRLEKQYSLKSHYVCRMMDNDDDGYTYELYANAANTYVPIEEKRKWVVNYEIYVRSSIVYKFWIICYKIVQVLDKMFS